MRPCWTRTLLLVALAGAAAAADPALRRGNDAFHEGKFEEAASIYESEETDADLLVRRFNAGVSWEKAGSIDKALERFEEVSAKAEGELRSASFYNAGHASFQKGRALGEAADALEDSDEKAKKLAEAGKAFHSAIQFFRSVDPPDASTVHNLAVAKTALRSVLDQIARIEAEKKKKSEDDALKSPAQLLGALADKERVHRAASRALAKEAGRNIRLGARRLRKSTEENRALAERLQHSLTAPPPATPPPAAGAPAPPGPQPPSAEEKERNDKATAAIGRAIEAQKDAEIAHGKLDVLAAAAAHSRAVTELRAAQEFFPLDVAHVIQEGVGRQERLNEGMESIAKAATGGVAPETKGSGVGKMLVDALKDKVLLPLAKLVSPASFDDARVLADDEDDVVWGSNILSQAEIPPSPAEAQGSGASPHAPTQPGAAPGTPPALSPEKAKELSEGLRAAGKDAHDASTRARDALAAAHPVEALPAGRDALAALRRAADLLPKPPRPPEERLRELIVKQKQAQAAVDGLKDLADDARTPARTELEASQRKDGKEAGEVATELESRAQGGNDAAAQPAPQGAPPEKAAEAAKKVREGQEKVFTSAELLAKDQREDARTAVERDVALFEEALALLSGKQGEKKDQQQDSKQEQPQEQGAKKNEPKKSPNNADKPYALSPRDARLKQQEMDRKRREEESKLFSPPSGMTVERDW